MTTPASNTAASTRIENPVAGAAGTGASPADKLPRQRTVASGSTDGEMGRAEGVSRATAGALDAAVSRGKSPPSPAGGAMGSAVGRGDNVAAPAGSSESNGNTAAGRREGE